MPPFIDLTGERFGRWTVRKRYHFNAPCGAVCWVCRCDCGAVRIVRGNDLRRGNSLSCGCYRKEFLSKLKTGKPRSKLTKKRVSEAAKGRKRLDLKDGRYFMVKPGVPITQIAERHGMTVTALCAVLRKRRGGRRGRSSED